MIVLSNVVSLIPISILNYLDEEGFTIELDNYNCCNIDMTNKVLYLDIIQINKFVSMFGCSFTTALTCIIAHEIGHNLLLGYGENYHDEIEAWVEGYHFLVDNNEKIDKTTFYAIRDYCLNKYLAVYDHSLQIYYDCLRIQWETETSK